MAQIDVSEELCDGYSVGFCTGDVPDFYYCLELPPWLWPWFCIEGLSVRDLRRALAEEGISLSSEWDGAEYVSIAAVGMGFSWGCFLAQVTLEDMTDEAQENLSWFQALIYGLAVPQLRPNPNQDAILWRYIDDYAAMVLELAVGPGNSEDDRPRLAATAKALRESIYQHGLRVHKEEFGTSVVSLGFVLKNLPASMRVT